MTDNYLFDFEGAGSPIEPFDVWTINGDCLRFLPSPTRYGQWIGWVAQSDGSAPLGFGSEEHMHSRGVPEFLSAIPALTLMATGEDSFADYLSGAAHVVWIRMIDVMNGDNFNSYQIYDAETDGFKIHARDPTPTELPICAIQLKTLIQTAWAVFSITRINDKTANYAVLPQIGAQFKVFGAEESNIEEAGMEWQVQINCNWEPDEDMYARHEMAYGATKEKALEEALQLQVALRAEWQQNIDKSKETAS